MKKGIPVFTFLLMILLSSNVLDVPTKAVATEASVLLTMEEMETYFEAESLEYYAYMDMETAPEELRQIIREAQCRIIFSSGWVADEIDGWILDEDGNVIEELPHFSEIFPEDWEVPTSEEACSH